MRLGWCAGLRPDALVCLQAQEAFEILGQAAQQLENEQKIKELKHVLTVSGGGWGLCLGMASQPFSDSLSLCARSLSQEVGFTDVELKGKLNGGCLAVYMRSATASSNSTPCCDSR